MKRFNRLAWFTGAAMLCNVALWTTMSGCSGDNNGSDAGDSGNDQTTADVKIDGPTADVVNDVTPDVVIGDGGPDVIEFMKFQQDYANTLCARLAPCCYTSQLDASAPDGAAAYCAQQTMLYGGGIENPIGDLRDPVVMNSGHLVMDETAKASCLAGLATLSCPLITGTEYAANAQNCVGAIHGNVSLGGSCRRSIECVNGGFCQWPDGGLASDGGENGTCIAISGDGGPCTDPRGNGNEQCVYRGWVGTQNLRCDNQNADASANTNTCQPRIAQGTSCIQEWECTTNTCGDNLTCDPPSTQWTLTFPGFCPFYFGDDAGFQ